MQRLASLAAHPEIGGGLAACRPRLSPWKKVQAGGGQPAMHRRQWAGVNRACPARPLSGGEARCSYRRKLVFVGQKHRLFSSQPGADGPAGSSGGQPAISVVGVPDPITWIRCKVMMFLTSVYFDVDLSSEGFDRGVKQALVHVSIVMSRGRYHELKGIVSDEMMEYVEKRCKSLTKAQRQKLAVSLDDIIFVFPEDVSVVFDQYGRKFCFIIMRFWLLSTQEGPDDPEGTKIFKVAAAEDGRPQKKLATAVYEFHRELTMGASSDWRVTTVWHWHWNLAE